MSRKRNWLLILFGVGVLLVFIAIGVVIAATAWVRQNVQVTDTTAASAMAEFDTVRQQFAGRPAILELRHGRPAYTGKREKLRDGAATTPLQALHILVWDPERDRLVSFSVPFWLLRLKSGSIEFSSYASGMDDEGVDIRPDDIKQYGPGIILDATTPEGERVLLWTR